MEDRHPLDFPILHIHAGSVEQNFQTPSSRIDVFMLIVLGCWTYDSTV